MQITKHEHACLRLDKSGATLIVDPGSFTAPLEDLGELVAVVITHEHPDHWTAAHLESLRTHAPGLRVIAPAGAADAIEAALPDCEVERVAPGDSVAAGPFALRFFGGTHAVIHESIPVIDNVGVLVDDVFYYPGDSYAVPEGVSVDLLAVPVGAPWLKIGEAMDFVLAVAPRRAFGTHDMTLSAAGLAMGRDRLAWASAQADGGFERLEPGQHLTL